MQLSDFDFPFDPTLIADRPVEPRDQARLLVLPRGGGPCAHDRVADLPKFLRAGDLLVVNDTKVMAVRLQGRKRPGGGSVELLLIKDLGGDTWEAMVKGGVKGGQVIELSRGATATVMERTPEATVVKIQSGCPVPELIRDIGLMPLPPYIKRPPIEADRVWYQSLFARAEGAVAAPTASLHFTPQLLAAVRDRGVHLASVTLHVGPGTFRPVSAVRVETHRMAPEWYEVPAETVHAIRQARTEGGRIVAVGTTVVRSLEAAASGEIVQPTKGETGLFIVPGYRFKVVDGLMTNFHLPRTTLLMLVAAMVGLEPLREAYQEAIRARYRFYSYGDAMLIL
jgi:S-adenosylmethionine:tRNA ribosyltransferase-isomerase